jgi:hypothetical protein
MTYHTSLLVIIMLVCYRQRVGMAASRLTQAHTPNLSIKLPYKNNEINQLHTFFLSSRKSVCECTVIFFVLPSVVDLYPVPHGSALVGSLGP